MVPDELWEILALLPPTRALAREGRPAQGAGSGSAGRDPVRAPHRMPVELPAERDGLGLREHLLAATARLAGGRRLAAARARAPRPPRRCRPDRLEPGRGGLHQHRGKKGGEATGPNPTDRGKQRAWPWA